MPTRCDPAPVCDADRRICRDLIRAGSKSFFAASLLLPRRVREPALALYAFCRQADDAVDGPGSCRGGGTGGGGGSLAADDPESRPRVRESLARLHERLESVYAGRPASAVDRAFADVVARFEIPRALPEALLEGFAWDALGRRYEDEAQLLEYAARVAGSVGAMMTCIMGVRDAATAACACELGVAMQLTNIARDVGDDARLGRVYLPLGWLRGEGVDPVRWLRAPVWTPSIGFVVRRLLEMAERLYEKAEVGIDALPSDCRAAIRAARLLYAQIGQEVLRNGADSVSVRAVVPTARKAQLLVRALSGTGSISREAARRSRSDVPLAAVESLLHAVTSADRSVARAGELVSAAGTEPSASSAAAADLGSRLAWLVDLFQRLEQREHSCTPHISG